MVHGTQYVNTYIVLCTCSSATSTTPWWPETSVYWSQGSTFPPHPRKKDIVLTTLIPSHCSNLGDAPMNWHYHSRCDFFLESPLYSSCCAHITWCVLGRVWLLFAMTILLKSMRTWKSRSSGRRRKVGWLELFSLSFSLSLYLFLQNVIRQQVNQAIMPYFVAAQSLFLYFVVSYHHSISSTYHVLIFLWGRVVVDSYNNYQSPVFYKTM